MIIGYARTSTTDQIAGLEAQLRELQSAGCAKIFKEQAPSVDTRLQLESAIEFIREGDVLKEFLDRFVFLGILELPQNHRQDHGFIQGNSMLGVLLTNTPNVDG